MIEIKCVALVCDNNGRRRQPLFDTSAIRRAFNSSHSIGLLENNAAHTVNNLKENRYCSFRHCSKTVWIFAICFHFGVENPSLNHQRLLRFEDFRPKLELTFRKTRAFSALSRVSYSSRDKKRCHFSTSDIEVVIKLDNGCGSDRSE